MSCRILHSFSVLLWLLLLLSFSFSFLHTLAFVAFYMHLSPSLSISSSASYSSIIFCSSLILNSFFAVHFFVSSGMFFRFFLFFFSALSSFLSRAYVCAFCEHFNVKEILWFSSFFFFLLNSMHQQMFSISQKCQLFVALEEIYFHLIDIEYFFFFLPPIFYCVRFYIFSILSVLSSSMDSFNRLCDVVFYRNTRYWQTKIEPQIVCVIFWMVFMPKNKNV